MTDARVLEAYGAHASEYTARLGAIDDMHELDRRRIERWAKQISGSVVDAGCGPGHWTDMLNKLGVEISGVDLVPEFIASARARFPDVSFQISSLRALDAAAGSLGGLLAWYSLIHLPQKEIPSTLREFARVLRPEGHLLVGFFRGEPGEPFDHAVTRAYYSSLDQMSFMLHDAGFEVDAVETRQDLGSRPHAAISAIKR